MFIFCTIQMDYNYSKWNIFVLQLFLRRMIQHLVFRVEDLEGNAGYNNF